MKPIVSDTGKNQSGLFVIFVVVYSKLMLGKRWIHEMWVLSKQVLTVRHNVSHLKLISSPYCAVSRVCLCFFRFGSCKTSQNVNILQLLT